MKFLLIDAFAERPFTGNPAAVVLVETALEDEWMQALAMEFNQAETAFVWPRADGAFDLRWFTPLREVALCGHATLAAARALREWGLVDASDIVRFITRKSGELRCTFQADQILMDFPATPPAPIELPAPAEQVLKVAGPVQCIGTTTMNLTLRLPDRQQVESARPDLRALAQWHPVGVTITAPGGGPAVDFVSRFFAPAAGIDEDPVTGSAYCALAVYWAAELQKTQFVAQQLSRRGGELGVRLIQDRVQLAGKSVITARGTIDAAFS